MIIVRILVLGRVVAWLAVVAVGIWGFVTLSDLGEFRTDGSPRTIFDKAVPYVFLLLSPFGLFMFRKELKLAKHEISIAETEAAKTIERKQRAADAKRRLANCPPLTDGIKQAALATVDHYKTAGVVGEAELDRTTFLDFCETHHLESGDHNDTAIMLALFSRAHGDFTNALFIDDQVEVTEADIREVVQGFARLANQSITDLNVSFSNPRKGGSDGMARFSLRGEPRTLSFEYHNKYASSSLMEELATTFSPPVPYAVAYFDSVYLISCLTENDRTALNAALDKKHAIFERF